MNQLRIDFTKIPSDFTPNYQTYHLQEVAERDKRIAERDRRIAELENEVRAGKRSKRTSRGNYTKLKNKFKQ